MTDVTAWFAFSGQRLVLRVGPDVHATLPGETDLAALMPSSGIAGVGTEPPGKTAAGTPLDVSLGGWSARAVDLDEEAGWYAPDALPGLPTSFSIARRLIDDFVARGGRAR